MPPTDADTAVNTWPAVSSTTYEPHSSTPSAPATAVATTASGMAPATGSAAIARALVKNRESSSARFHASSASVSILSYRRTDFIVPLTYLLSGFSAESPPSRYPPMLHTTAAEVTVFDPYDQPTRMAWSLLLFSVFVGYSVPVNTHARVPLRTAVR